MNFDTFKTARTITLIQFLLQIYPLELKKGVIFSRTTTEMTELAHELQLTKQETIQRKIKRQVRNQKDNHHHHPGSTAPPSPEEGQDLWRKLVRGRRSL